MEDLTITTEPVGADTLCLVLHGVLDYATVAQCRTVLTSVLNDGRYRHLLLDLDEVYAMDTAGVATIMVGARLAELVGVRLHVGSASAEAASALRLPEPVKNRGPVAPLELYARERAPVSRQRARR